MKRLHAYTGIPWQDVQRVSWWLRRAGIWGRDGSWRAMWAEEDQPNDKAVIEFVLHTMAATGDLLHDADRDTYRRHEIRQYIPHRPLKRIGGEAEQAEPWWVRKHDLAEVPGV